MDGYNGDEVFDQEEDCNNNDDSNPYSDVSEEDQNEKNEINESVRSEENHHNFDDFETTSESNSGNLEEEENQIDWNEKFQNLVEKTYFRMGEEDYSAERQYELSIQLKQLCAQFAEEAAKIGVQIVKERVFIHFFFISFSM